MKKYSFPIILFVLTAMILSACSAGTVGAPTPGGATQGTTAATTVGTSTGNIPSTGSATGTAVVPEVTGTMAAGGAGGTTGTPAASVGTPAATTSAGTGSATATQETMPAATVAATSGAVATTVPSAGTPAATATGATSGSTANANYVRLSDLMKSNVNDKSNTSIGKIDGILVEHPALPTAASGATPTPAASGAPAGLFVRYVVVNAASSTPAASGSGASRGKDILIPWQAFTFASNAQTSGTFSANIESAAVASAPRIGLVDLASGSTAWSAPTASFWSGQGVSIPATGAPATGMVMTLIPSNMRNINIADAADTVLGPVADFLVDPSTGEVMYAVFNGGSAFNNRTFVIPMANLTWNATTPVGGNFNFNFDAKALNSAPFINSLTDIANGLGLSSQLNQFWNAIPTAVPPAPTAAP